MLRAAAGPAARPVSTVAPAVQRHRRLAPGRPVVDDHDLDGQRAGRPRPSAVEQRAQARPAERRDDDA